MGVEGGEKQLIKTYKWLDFQERSTLEQLKLFEKVCRMWG